MSSFKKMKGGVAALFIGAAMVLAPVAAHAKKVHIRVQAVIGTQTTEVKMLKDFMSDVTALTGGDVTFEVLPAGAVVGNKETLRVSLFPTTAPAGSTSNVTSPPVKAVTSDMKSLSILTSVVCVPITACTRI